MVISSAGPVVNKRFPGQRGPCGLRMRRGRVRDDDRMILRWMCQPDNGAINIFLHQIACGTSSTQPSPGLAAGQRADWMIAWPYSCSLRTTYTCWQGCRWIPGMSCSRPGQDSTAAIPVARVTGRSRCRCSGRLS